MNKATLVASNTATTTDCSGVKERAQTAAANSLTAGLPFLYPDVHTHTLFIGFRDEFAFAIDAGVGTLPSNALLPLWNVPRGW